MDLLTAAVVDITTLVATCHALKSMPTAGDVVLTRKLRGRLRRDIKRGTVAYIDALARAMHGVVDDALLRTCRVCAEQHMARALEHQEQLARIMTMEPGALGGLAAARQDLWRLAHMSIYLSIGMTNLREVMAISLARSVNTAEGRLRRRFRKALIAYARAALRTKAARGRLIVMARAAALAEIGARGTRESERLAAFEAAAGPALSVIQQGVTKPLRDLALDWKRQAPEMG